MTDMDTITSHGYGLTLSRYPANAVAHPLALVRRQNDNGRLPSYASEKRDSRFHVAVVSYYVRQMEYRFHRVYPK